MPIVRIDFDKERVSVVDAETLSFAVQKIVAEETQIVDVIVYANNSEIKIHAWPIEIFVQMSAQKIVNEDELFEALKSRIVAWKKESDCKFVRTVQAGG